MKRSDIDKIASHFYGTASDEEECAVVFFDDNTREYRVVGVPNAHPDFKTRFRILSNDAEEARDFTERLVAVVHTHPSHVKFAPSYEDVTGLPDGLVGIVVQPRRKLWVLYDKDAGILAYNFPPAHAIYNNDETLVKI